MELTVKKIKIKFEGAEYDLRHPSVRELRDFQTAEGDDLDKTLALLEKCGLPSSVTEAFDVESLNQVVEAITPKKKA